MDALLRAHADARTRDNEGLTPLHRAVQGRGPVEARQPDMVRQLLRAGADPNAKSDRGVTPLMFLGDGTEVARLLREGGADVNARDGKGRTALMTSGFSCAPSTTRFLLEAGARKDDRVADGRSAHDFAREGAEGQLAACEANLRGIAGSLSDGGLEARCVQLRAQCEATLHLLE
jgi:ankyrin repeat protein